jgi:hypothetical protein
MALQVYKSSLKHSFFGQWSYSQNNFFAKILCSAQNYIREISIVIPR